MEAFDVALFRRRVRNALDAAETLLEAGRVVMPASEVHHKYEDKFALVESLGTLLISSIAYCLKELGVSDSDLSKMKGWVKERTVTLAFKSTETCSFAKKTEEMKESDTKHVTKSTVFGTSESKTVTKITTYFWTVGITYELVAYRGTEADKPIVLLSRSASCVIKSTTEFSPRSATMVVTPLTVNITWLMQHLAKEGGENFIIDRPKNDCRTPRRNTDVDAALAFGSSWRTFCHGVAAYLRSVFDIEVGHGIDTASANDNEVFVPVVPFFEQHAEEAHGSLIDPAVCSQLAAEEKRTLGVKFTALQKVFSSGNNLVTFAEARIIVIAMHCSKVVQAFSDGVQSVEQMLLEQLIAAIGKEVSPADLSAYLVFHNRKLYQEAFQPRAFSYPVFRAKHAPEGTLSIMLRASDGTPVEPIYTSVSYAPAMRRMRMTLGAAAQVEFGGERYVHGWVSTRFGGAATPTDSLALVARARQFSSFIVVIGRIVAADQIDPQYAIVVQNKDDVMIPLLLETIPSAKEFKDAIESLSPEQQRFAKAYRSMQLESTLFGVCVLQIKPQMERLLRLPEGSLTKEIELTQDLMKLFMEYQLPSDLVSFNGKETATAEEKLQAVRIRPPESLWSHKQVKKHTAAMLAMINEAKLKEIANAKEKREATIAQMSVSGDPEKLFTREQRIGRGSIGEVYRGLDNRTGQEVAIKIVSQESIDSEDLQDIQDAVTACAGLQSPYLAQYYSMLLHAGKLWLVSEYAQPGSALDMVRIARDIYPYVFQLKPQAMKEKYVAIIMREVLRGLEYLHAHGKVHGNIKAANVLITLDANVKLCDYGVAAALHNLVTKKNTFFGTPFWMAPEVIKQTGSDAKSDIWSVGITTIEMLKGEPPYADLHPMRALFLIPKNTPSSLSGDFSRHAKDFVSACLRAVSSDRAGATELLKHKFIRRAGRTRELMELIQRSRAWKSTAGYAEEEGDGSADKGDRGGADWAFDDHTKESWKGKPESKQQQHHHRHKSEERDRKEKKEKSVRCEKHSKKSTPGAEAPSDKGAAEADPDAHVAADALDAAPPGDSLSKETGNDTTARQVLPARSSNPVHFDYTQVPTAMEAAQSAVDTDGAVRPTIINVGDDWRRDAKASLLSAVVRSSLNRDAQKTERSKALDLLDALTRSGVLAFESGAALHVVVAATHCFAKTVMETVVQSNVDPIERIEQTSLVVSSVVHHVPPEYLVKQERADAESIVQLSSKLLH